MSSTSFEQSRAFLVLEKQVKTHKIDLNNICICVCGRSFRSEESAPPLGRTVFWRGSTELKKMLIDGLLVQKQQQVEKVMEFIEGEAGKTGTMEAPIEDGMKNFLRGFEKRCWGKEKRCWGKSKTTCRKNRRQI